MYQGYGREFLLASNCFYETKQKDIYKRFPPREFKIANIPFTPYDCFALGCLLSQVPFDYKHQVDIWNCSLHERHVEYLLKGLKCIPMKDGGPEIDEKCAKILSELLQYNYEVCHECSDLGANGLMFYLQSIMKTNCTRSQRIILKGSNVIINDSNGPLLERAVAERLRLLNLEDNLSIAGAQGVSYISRGIQCQLSFLCDLNLANCNLTSLEAKLMAEGLKVNGSLLKINLSNNNIGWEGAESIAEALEHNTTLEILDLRVCHLTVGEMIKLTEILKVIGSLKQLDLLHV